VALNMGRSAVNSAEGTSSRPGILKVLVVRTTQKVDADAEPGGLKQWVVIYGERGEKKRPIKAKKIART